MLHPGLDVKLNVFILACASNDTARLVLPTPLVPLVKVMVSEYAPWLREFAAVLIEAVTTVLPPGLTVPLLGDKVSQLAVFAAVHDSGPVPLLETVNVELDGVNDPPDGPDEFKLPAVTPMVGAPPTTKDTVRVALPSPVVEFTKVKVAE